MKKLFITLGILCLCASVRAQNQSAWSSSVAVSAVPLASTATYAEESAALASSATATDVYLQPGGSITWPDGTVQVSSPSAGGSVSDPLSVNTLQSNGNDLTIRSAAGKNIVIQPTSTDSGNGANLTLKTGGTTDMAVSGSLYLDAADGSGHIIEGAYNALKLGSAAGIAFVEVEKALRINNANGVYVSTGTLTGSPGGLGVRGTNQFYAVDGSSSTGVGTALLGTNSPANSLSAPTYWVSVKRCALNGTSCVTGYMPVWE